MVCRVQYDMHAYIMHILYIYTFIYRYDFYTHTYMMMEKLTAAPRDAHTFDDPVVHHGESCVRQYRRRCLPFCYVALVAQWM
jgi:hypothetical protein